MTTGSGKLLIKREELETWARDFLPFRPAVKVGMKSFTMSDDGKELIVDYEFQDGAEGDVHGAK